jgi:hypothetical protein
MAKWGHPLSRDGVNLRRSSGGVEDRQEAEPTPMTFSLLHATDFADRLLYNIILPLKAGMTVPRTGMPTPVTAATRRAASIGAGCGSSQLRRPP